MKRTVTRRRWLLLAGGVGATGLAGCSSSETTTPADQPTGTEDATGTASQTESTTDSETEPDNDGQIDPEQAAKLAADDGDGGDTFGEAVALADGSTALVGARGDEGPDGDADIGSAYIFTHDGGSWTQQTKFTPDGAEEDDFFGTTVALTDDGTTAFVARTGARTDAADAAGAVHVYSQDGGSWTQQTTLTVDDATVGESLGSAIALTDDGATALIGATGEESNGDNAGAVYVFTDDGGSWSQQATLTADDGDADDYFGKAIAVASDTAIIGADQDEDPNGDYGGSAYVFSRDGDTWSQQTKLTADDGDNFDQFGEEVALGDDGTTALVGAASDEDPNGDFSGSVYVFSAESGSWSQQAKLTPDDGDGGDSFGSSVSLAGGVGLIGADGDEDPNGDGAGSAYVFTEQDGSWTQRAKLSADDGDADDGFGGAAALSGDGRTALVGADGDEDPNGSSGDGVYTGSGSAYVFTL